MDVQYLVQVMGYPIVFLLIMGESVGIPLPGETALIVAAAAAGASGTFNLWGIIAAAATGALAGNSLGYWLGRRGGRAWLERLWKWLRLPLVYLQRAEHLFARHGSEAVLFGHFVTFLRVSSALLAGISHMPFVRFMVYNALGAILWATVFGVLGHVLGRNLPLLRRAMRDTGWAAAGVILVGIAAYILWHRAHTSNE
jgi:membrane protein DedA with SNARE-associated domain